jgi:hypothetical protein
MHSTLKVFGVDVVERRPRFLDHRTTPDQGHKASVTMKLSGTMIPEGNLREATMHNLTIAIVVAAAMAASVAAASADESCKAQAADKKLAGAALTSFMTKCEKDATAACDIQAADKKLSGAAKDSFTKKCVKDAVGT